MITLTGWIFMIASWSLVIFLTFFSFHRTLKIEAEKKKQK